MGNELEKKETEQPNIPELTMYEMCEYIAKSGILTGKDGTKPTGEQLFNYSSRGELFKVFEWHSIALALQEANQKQL